MSKFAAVFLFLAGPLFLFGELAHAVSPEKPFSVQKPREQEVIETILDVAGKTDIRAVLLYGLLGQETGFGANTGKTEAQWNAICADRDTKACRYWEKYDCKPDYFNARHYDEILEYLGYSKKDIPASYTCALGFTQFEPNTWWGLMQRKNLKDLNPWNIQDAVLMAAYYLEERGATKFETLEDNEVIGRSDEIALQRYYCGPNYTRPECVGYAKSAAKIVARAPSELFRKDLEDQLQIFKEEQEAIKKKFEKREKPRFKPIRLPSFETPQQVAPSPEIPPPPSFATPEAPKEINYPSVEFRSLEDATVGTAYHTILSASGGTPPYQWKISGEKLPDGLTLDLSSGVISGTPTTSGGIGFFVTVTDNIGARSIASWLSVMVNDAPEIVVYDLPKALFGSSYRGAVYVGGGTPPYKWNIKNFPDGLHLDTETGTISGTPTKLGKYDVVLTVTDSNGAVSKENQFTLSIFEIPIIKERALPKGKVGIPFDAVFKATGGLTPYTWDIFSSTNLPDGLTFNTASGIISGTPNESGYYFLNVKMSDMLGAESNWANFSLIIESAPSVSTLNLPDGFVGAPYRANLYASGGTEPYSWALDEASRLPEDLSLNPSGVILGTPAKSGFYGFRVFTFDSERTKSELKLLTISIAEKPSVTKSFLPDAGTGSSYKAVLSASGGMPPYSWSLAVENQRLPDGLTLDSSTGVIAGIPTKSGWYGFFVEVTDSIGTKSNWEWFSVAVPELRIIAATETLNKGYLGISYYAPLYAVGGTPPYTWSIYASTTLPNGLALDPATGIISGMPTKIGTYDLSVAFMDSNKLMGEAKKFTIPIVEKPVITSAAFLPPATVGVAYTTSITAVGGVPPYIWKFATATDKLPVGFTLDFAAGVISGIPSESGGFGFSIKVTDSIGTDSDWPWFSISIGRQEIPTATSTIATSTAPILLDFRATMLALQQILRRFGQ